MAQIGQAKGCGKIGLAMANIRLSKQVVAKAGRGQSRKSCQPKSRFATDDDRERGSKNRTNNNTNRNKQHKPHKQQNERQKHFGRLKAGKDWVFQRLATENTAAKQKKAATKQQQQQRQQQQNWKQQQQKQHHKQQQTAKVAAKAARTAMKKQHTTRKTSMKQQQKNDKNNTKSNKHLGTSKVARVGFFHTTTGARKGPNVGAQCGISVGNLLRARAPTVQHCY